jgi:Ca2+-binding RTX toxin-like protein
MRVTETAKSGGEGKMRIVRPIVGTPGFDVLCGMGGDDRLYGQRGRDTVIGRGGNDRLHGGNGIDASGNDAVFGGPGIDRYRSDPGDDVTNAEIFGPCFAE